MMVVQVSEVRHYITFPCDASYAYSLQDHYYLPCSALICFLATE